MPDEFEGKELSLWLRGPDHERGRQQGQRDRRGGREQIEAERLATHATELAHVVERCRSTHERDEDQGHDQELQTGEEDRSDHVEEPFHQVVPQDSLPGQPVDQHPDDEARRHRHQDAEGELLLRRSDRHAFPPFFPQRAHAKSFDSSGAWRSARL